MTVCPFCDIANTHTHAYVFPMHGKILSQYKQDLVSRSKHAVYWLWLLVCWSCSTPTEFSSHRGGGAGVARGSGARRRLGRAGRRAHPASARLFGQFIIQLRHEYAAQIEVFRAQVEALVRNT